MKRTFLAFALAVTLVATLAACSSRPADTNNGAPNNGTVNSTPSTPNPVTPSTGTGRPNSGSGSAAGNDSVIQDDLVDDGIMDDEFVDDEFVDDGVVEDDLVDVDPAVPNARARSAARRSGDYCADCNGNLADWDREETIGDAARSAVDGVVNGVRRAGTAVGDMAQNLTRR